jgi:hypothetical protein
MWLCINLQRSPASLLCASSATQLSEDKMNFCQVLSSCDVYLSGSTLLVPLPVA